MANIDELDRAIGDHENWKIRLKGAIESGEIEIPIETIRMDNQCDLGKWLYGYKISSKDKSSTHYKSVKILHSQFHRTAAQVVKLALDGKKDEAEKMMATDGNYTMVSLKLTQAMMDWKAELK